MVDELLRLELEDTDKMRRRNLMRKTSSRSFLIEILKNWMRLTFLLLLSLLACRVVVELGWRLQTFVHIQTGSQAPFEQFFWTAVCCVMRQTLLLLLLLLRRIRLGFCHLIHFSFPKESLRVV